MGCEKNKARATDGVNVTVAVCVYVCVRMCVAVCVCVCMCAGGSTKCSPQVTDECFCLDASRIGNRLPSFV